MELAGLPNDIVSHFQNAVGNIDHASRLLSNPVRTGVWKIMSKSQPYLIKLHAEKRKWHPEVYAYRHWIRSLGKGVPSLVDVIEAEKWQGIITTFLPGKSMRSCHLTKAAEMTCYRIAAQLLRQIHTSATGEWFGIPRLTGEPLGRSITDPVEHMKRDFDMWYSMSRTHGSLSSDEIELAEWALDNMDVYAGEKPVPIHKDFTPGNWLVETEGSFSGIIDFECMEWGVEVDSLCSLWTKYFPDRQDREEAFWKGYGADPSLSRPLQVRNVTIKMGIAGIGYGSAHGIPALVENGHKILKRLRNNRI